MLSSKNEWIAVGALIAYIAFMPTLPAVREVLSSAVGKALALALVVYVWKTVSQPVAILLIVAILRSGAIREYADDASMKPADETEHCPAGFDLDAKTSTCKKGDETRAAIKCSSGEEWDSAMGACKPKATPPKTTTKPAGGPPSGTTGAAAAQAALEAAPKADTVEKFTPYGGKDDAFSPV